jgi:hypothetical protein
VEVAGKTLLVGTSEMGLSVLSELDAAEVKSRVVPQQSFADLVRGAWQRRRGLAKASAAATASGADGAGRTGTRNPATDGENAGIESDARDGVAQGARHESSAAPAGTNDAT